MLTCVQWLTNFVEWIATKMTAINAKTISEKLRFKAQLMNPVLDGLPQLLAALAMCIFD